MLPLETRTAPLSRTRRGRLCIHWGPLAGLGLVLASGATVLWLCWLLWRLLG